MYNGYAHRNYAESLAEFGTPYELPNSGSWILVRNILEYSYVDAIGCYPLFTCINWNKLSSDLNNLSNKFVSFAGVLDPFGNYDKELLSECFPNIVLPFKKHYVIDLKLPINKVISNISKHHRYYSKKAKASVKVEVCREPMIYYEDWISLYNMLIERHNISGIRAFSRKSFKIQFNLPGLRMFRASIGDMTIGAHLWVIDKKIATSHLAAYNSTGYKLLASYALYLYAIEYFSGCIEWLNLGGGAGVKTNDEDGLAKFKSGWTSDFVTAYYCGRIINPDIYNKLIKELNIPPTDFFPAYRIGEHE
jgi:hypothetical protein